MYHKYAIPFLMELFPYSSFFVHNHPQGNNKKFTIHRT